MKNFLLLIFLITGFSAFSQIQISNNCKADLLEINTQLKQNKQLVTESLRGKFPINTISNTNYISMLAVVNESFDASILENDGILIGARVKDIVSLKFPIHAIENILNTEGIKQLQIAGKIKPNLSKVLYDTRADSVHQGLGLPSSYTGKDVLIGITDWGFDYSHPMFYDTLLNESRILAAWDQFKNEGPAPSAYGYGTEYNSLSALASAAADTANIYSYATHGSHVAGIAGGSGAGTPYRGVAFESQFLFTTFLVDEAAVLDAWDWMYNKSQAEGKRLVINMSWGLYHTGAIDGTSILSEALDAFSDLGVVFVTSAGNNGDVNFHLKKEFANDTLTSRVLFYSSSTLESLWGQSIHGWGEPEKPFTTSIRILNSAGTPLINSPWYTTESTDTYVDSFLVIPATADTIFYNLSMDNSYPSNERPQMRLRIKKPSPIYRIDLQASATDGTVHFWNVTELSTDVGNWGMSFTSAGSGYTLGDNEYGIGAPACSNSAITVAAHSASFETGSGSIVGGSPAAFSSLGPLMTEQMKPDISGPGVSVASSISSYTDNGYTPVTTVSFEGRDYPFARFSGTSMSSPAVAGVVALMLEANPYLSALQVKQIITQTAREDSHTGVITTPGDPKWGYGKINAYAAVIKAIQTTGWVEIENKINWTLYPNPTQHILNIDNLSEQVQSIEIYNLSGQLLFQSQPQNSIHIETLLPGTYLLRVIQENKVEQQKFVIQ